MNAQPFQPELRLAGRCDPEVLQAWKEARDAREQVIHETRAAARNTQLDPTDARWVLAARAYSQLDGATLGPRGRDRVLGAARSMGVRPFDANLIMAIVQDGARRGEDLGATQPRLALLAPPPPVTRPSMVRWTFIAAAASLFAGLLGMWVSAG